MTRDEAIFVLEHIEAHGSLAIKAKEMAIEALKQEPCEDAISRQAAIDTLEKHQYSLEYCKEHGIDYSVDMGMARIALNGLPPVTPKQRTGHWEW